ncbi:hypothetical protein [Kitasatospora sp. LaBMicrA B282]|uniref:hypothetical protein n=1 Tax=Kitasatospora sp. LaBMicrA B282 TaxID=3420949 RepID=UPI003D09AEA2
MSLSPRVLAVGAAAAVIAAASVGASVAYAASQPTPNTTKVTVTVGRNSHQVFPTPACWNGGKPLDTQARQNCAALSNQPAGSYKDKITVKSNDRIGVGIDPDSAKNGWRAFTNGGGGQGAVVANFQKDNTFSGLQPAANLLTSNRDTALTVIEFDPKTADTASPGIIAVWFVDLVNNSLPVGQATPDASQGQ